ncbi:MAG: methyltransferase domain-containing protein [Planctomycetes bacterium]|nr:methyltransferase domain-containing protein [Planctomycetota bacterium]
MPTLLGGAAALVLFVLWTLTPSGTRLRRRMMARLYAQVQRRYEEDVAERKRVLLARLSGTVLEIGPGTGANFPFLPDRVTEWIGLEPNPYMHAELRRAAAARGLEPVIRGVGAEGMEVETESVDFVLCTLVLCSVSDPAAVLSDVLRVLKPGGGFVFLEHVAAESGTALRRRQRWLRPLWRYLADGCRLDRETGETIRRAGFEHVELEEFELERTAAPSVIAPHIAGIARKPGSRVADAVV